MRIIISRSPTYSIVRIRLCVKIICSHICSKRYSVIFIGESHCVHCNTLYFLHSRFYFLAPLSPIFLSWLSFHHHRLARPQPFSTTDFTIQTVPPAFVTHLPYFQMGVQVEDQECTLRIRCVFITDSSENMEWLSSNAKIHRIMPRFIYFTCPAQEPSQMESRYRQLLLSQTSFVHSLLISIHSFVYNIQFNRTSLFLPISVPTRTRRQRNTRRNGRAPLWTPRQHHAHKKWTTRVYRILLNVLR